MNKRYLPIMAATAVLAAVALFGYLRPVEGQKMPVRILLDNTGGNVVFTHLAHHRDYKIPCADCHHEGARATPLPCGSCHAVSFDKEFVAEHINSFPDQQACVKCHHAEFGGLDFDHEKHKEYAGDCQACHHGPEIEPEPRKCRDCHSVGAGEPGMPSVRDATHTRCANCHQEMFEKGLKGCTPCHKLIDMHGYEGPYTSCRQCHDKPQKDLVLTRTQAFHDQCMNCHEKLRKGPYGDKDCAKCHQK